MEVCLPPKTTRLEVRSLSDANITVGLHWREYLVPVNIVFIVVGAVVVNNKHQFLHIQAASTYTKLPIRILKKSDL